MITKNAVADVAFWSGVDTDQQAVDTAKAVTAATVALSGTWPFLSAAQSAEEFEHRLALMQVQIEAQTPPEVLGEVVAGLRDKFTTLHTARLTETTMARTAARAIVAIEGQVSLPDAYVHVHKHGSGDDEYHQVDHVAGQGFLNTVAHTGDHDEAMAKARQYAQAASLPLYENGRYVEGKLFRELFAPDEEFFDHKTGRWVPVSALPNIQRTGVQSFRPGGAQGIGLSEAQHERMRGNWGDSLNSRQAGASGFDDFTPEGAQGYQHGRASMPNRNPHALGSPEHQSYETGHSEGTRAAEPDWDFSRGAAYQPDPDMQWRYKYPGVAQVTPGGGSPVNPVPGPGADQSVAQTSVGPDGFPMDFAQGEDRSQVGYQNQLTPGTWAPQPQDWPASQMPNAATGLPEGVRPGARQGRRDFSQRMAGFHKWMGTDGDSEDQCINCGVVAPDQGQGVVSDHGPLPLNCPGPQPGGSHHFTADGRGGIECARCGHKIDDYTDPKDVDWSCNVGHEASRRRASDGNKSTDDFHNYGDRGTGGVKSRPAAKGTSCDEGPPGDHKADLHLYRTDPNFGDEQSLGNVCHRHASRQGSKGQNTDDNGRPATPAVGLAALLSGMNDGDRRSVSTSDGRNSYMVGYNSEQALGDDNKPARGYTVGAYDVTHEQSGKSLGYYRHTPHGPTLTQAKPYAARQAADVIVRHTLDQQRHGSRYQAVEGIVPTPGPNPHYFDQGNQGLQGPPTFPENPSGDIEPKTDNHVDDVYGAVPPQVSSGSAEGYNEGGYARHGVKKPMAEITIAPVGTEAGYPSAGYEVRMHNHAEDDHFQIGWWPDKDKAHGEATSYAQTYRKGWKIPHEIPITHTGSRLGFSRSAAGGYLEGDDYGSATPGDLRSNHWHQHTSGADTNCDHCGGSISRGSPVVSNESTWDVVHNAGEAKEYMAKHWRGKDVWDEMTENNTTNPTYVGPNPHKQRNEAFRAEQTTKSIMDKADRTPRFCADCGVRADIHDEHLRKYRPDTAPHPVGELKSEHDYAVEQHARDKERADGYRRQGSRGFSRSAGERIDPDDRLDARELAELTEGDRIRRLREGPVDLDDGNPWSKRVDLSPNHGEGARRGSRRIAYDQHDRAAEADDARFDQHMEWQHLSGEHGFEPRPDCWVCQQGHGRRTASSRQASTDAPRGNETPYFKPGDHVEDHRGDTATVHTVIPSNHPGKSHRVQVTWDDPEKNRGAWEWAPGGGGFSSHDPASGRPGDQTPYYQHVFRHHTPEIGSAVDEAVPNEGDIRRAYASTNGQIVGKCDHCGEPVRYHTEDDEIDGPRGGHLRHLRNGSPRCKDGRTTTAIRVWMDTFEARMHVTASKAHFNPGHGGAACGASASSRWDSKTISTTKGTDKVNCEACKKTRVYQQALSQHTASDQEAPRSPAATAWVTITHPDAHPDYRKDDNYRAVCKQCGPVITHPDYDLVRAISTDHQTAHQMQAHDDLYGQGAHEREFPWLYQGAVLENPTADNPTGRGGDPYRSKVTWEGFEHQRPRQNIEGEGGMNANTPTTAPDPVRTGPNVNTPNPGSDLDKDGPRERSDEEEDDDDDDDDDD